MINPKASSTFSFFLLCQPLTCRKIHTRFVILLGCTRKKSVHLNYKYWMHSALTLLFCCSNLCLYAICRVIFNIISEIKVLNIGRCQYVRQTSLKYSILYMPFDIVPIFINIAVIFPVYLILLIHTFDIADY